MKTQRRTDKGFRCTEILILFSVLCFVFCVCGCEAFRKKFVRKPKKEKEIKVIVRTQEYEYPYSVVVAYKNYYLYWRAAHEELYQLLSSQDDNRKKRIFTAKRIVENLLQMQQLLLPEKRSKIDDYIAELNRIVQQLDRYKLTRLQKLRIKSTLDKQRRQIQKELHYRHIQDYLIER
jgi:hypothetical protein